MAGVQRDYLAEEEVGEEPGLASAPLTSSYLPFRSMTHFMYLIVKHRDLSVVTGQWGNTPGDCQIQLCPAFPPHTTCYPGFRFSLPGPTSSGKRKMRKSIILSGMDS